MKLVFRGHDERYVVEQSLMNLFPGELPVYEPITPGDDSWAVISLEETGDLCRVAVSLCRGGKTTEQTYQEPLSGGDFQREGLRRHAVGACFFLAARAVTGVTPPWGMLTGVRPDKPVTWALEDGKSPEEARAYLEEHYFVTPSRAALALETGATAAKAARRLEKRDIDVYVGIPFCPTRCAYCSFVSQSVERSFALVPPYVDALCGEISAGGEMVRRAGLRVRTFYMGGGTPTTLTAEQMDRVLTAFETSFDRTACEEITVEAGRPDTITAEKLAVLRTHGVTRVSVNPQTFEENVLRAIGRCHTAADIDRAMELVARQRAAEGFDYTTGYKSFSRKGTPLRSASLFLRDSQERLDYILCVNQDISAYVDLQQMLDTFIGDRPAVAQVQPEQDTLDDVVMKMILGEIARMKPADIDSKEAKLRLIKRLNEKGIFGARGAVGTVCELLHIAQPTLYKYLQEIKEE